MSGNLIVICLTVIICAVLLAFCHYNEHKEDLSTDRFEYLVQQIEILKRDMKDNDREIMDGFEERDREILQLRSALAPLHQGDGC